MSCVICCTLGGAKMDACGINKEIDRLGRIVIPKEMRELFNMTERVELVVTKDGILMRNPKFELVPKKERILK